ncbi:hypothetical protein [Neorhodopirellula pilleata]|nr:hypothetical protein [Neorhodopirellula pilleata]
MDTSLTHRAAELPWRFRLVLALWGVLTSVASTGCLALGVPSQRLHDPLDQGGLLGDWKANPSRTIAATTAELVSEGGVVVASHADCGSHVASEIGLLDLPPGACALDLDANGHVAAKPEKPPEVPWPKYHPVPTRPVFGVLSE